MEKIQYKIEAIVENNNNEEIFEYILIVEPRVEISPKSISETSDSINLKRITFQKISNTSDTIKISQNSLNEYIIIQVIAMIEEIFPDSNYRLILMNHEDYTISTIKVLDSFVSIIESKKFEINFEHRCTNNIVDHPSTFIEFFDLVAKVLTGKVSVGINYKKVEEWILEQQ